jgi:hypothetical protein
MSAQARKNSKSLLPGFSGEQAFFIQSYVFFNGCGMPYPSGDFKEYQ